MIYIVDIRLGLAVYFLSDDNNGESRTVATVLPEEVESVSQLV